MYSLVLMATMATPAMVPDCHRHRCSGSCYGSYYGSCHGCWGSNCNGCWGFTCSGCWGSSCNGCSGTAYYYSGSCWGGHSCYGCTGYHGCSGGYVVGSAPGYYGGTMGTPAGAAPAPAGKVQQAPAPAPSSGPGGAAPPPRSDASSAPAHIYVNLPADAKLYVDGQPTRTADKANRSFLTPDLNAGVEYRYVMKAEVVRDGQTQSETKTVIVRAGEEVREEFGSLLTLTTASNR